MGHHCRSGEVLHLAEMLNAERKDYKEQAAKHVRQRVEVGVHFHDCACSCSEFEDGLCRRTFLDAWHALKHKCSRRQFDPAHPKNSEITKKLNSQAAEQFWSRTDRLAAFCTQYSTGTYRLFLKRYCVWRNAYSRLGLRPDANKLRTRKAAVRRGDFVFKRPAGVMS